MRERKEDIPLLVEHFIKEFSNLHKRDVDSIEQEALNLLIEYEWPGNIRELRNLIESLVVLSVGNKITVQDLPSFMKKRIESKVINFPLGRPLAEIEKEYILKTLNETSGNKMRAAKLLKIGLKTLYRKLEKWRVLLIFSTML